MISILFLKIWVREDLKYKKKRKKFGEGSRRNIIGIDYVSFFNIEIKLKLRVLFRLRVYRLFVLCLRRLKNIDKNLEDWG